MVVTCTQSWDKKQFALTKTISETVHLMEWSIYKITNALSGLSYIGCTSNLPKRLGEHRFERPHIYIGGHTVEVLARESTREQAEVVEDRMIRAHNTLEPYGYNRRTGGSAGFVLSEIRLAKMRENLNSIREQARMARTGLKHSQETIERIRQAGIGRKHSEESKRKISEGNKGKTLSADARAKIRAKALGRIPSAESRQKMSAARKGKRRVFSDAHKQAMSEAAKRRPPVSAESRAKLSAASTGRKLSPEAREAHRAAMKLRREREIAAGIKTGMQGRTHSPETKEKIRLAAIRRHARRRASELS